MRALFDVPAPAKLNLFLHVVGQRTDGMHLLQSAFMLIDWCDTLHFELRGDGRISRDDLAAPLPQDDLIVRAAHALRAAGGGTPGVHISVAKRVPMQAGLGGGSSDAASTLLALNRLWRLRRTRQELAVIGAALGADVPFFLYGSNAWLEDVGTPVQAIDLPPAQFLVVKPAAGLDTGQIFRSMPQSAPSAPAIISRFHAAPYAFGRNDLQSIAEQSCPAVGDALKWLSQQGLSGRMSGSGSAVFARVPPGAWKPSSQQAAWPSDWQVRLCGNLAAHPLHGWAQG